MSAEMIIPDASWKQTDESMSNYDRIIPEGLDAELRAAPNEVYCHHYGWEFCGDVWFDGEQFCEAVYRYHIHMTTVTAPTLPELMAAVNEKWGDA